jgi:hypothetical protein
MLFSAQEYLPKGYSGFVCALAAEIQPAHTKQAPFCQDSSGHEFVAGPVQTGQSSDWMKASSHMKTLALVAVLFASALAQASQSPTVMGEASNTKAVRQAQKVDKTDASIQSIAGQNNGSGGPPEADHKNKRTDALAHKHDWVDWLNAGFTAVIALFTVCLFAGTFYQVRNLRDVERAWLVVDSWTTPQELAAYQYDTPAHLKSESRVQESRSNTGQDHRIECLLSRLRQIAGIT